jgi:uncharacterized NAD(P)/FAD-binding protein YdhS
MTIAHSTAWKSAEPIAAAGSIAIIGGGASGVLMAAHLLRDRNSNVEVTIVEKRKSLGRGLAYSTDLPDHVLNVRASNMSAFADTPDHFVGWLASRGIDVGDPATYFAPRRLYGEYLGELLCGAGREEDRPGRLSTIVEECVAIVEHNAAVELRLADGSRLVAERCVLATGHDHRQCRCDRSVAPYPMSCAEPVAPSEPVLIIGTGLSMVDACLWLILGGHTGPIVAVSRRGLLPAVHARTTPVVLEQADVPIGADMRLFVRWFRELVATVEAAGGGWRDVVDGLRPFSQLIWQNWSDSARRTFFRHVKAWWDIHRHRMAPQVFARLSAAIAEGQLRVVAGRVLAIDPVAGGARARLQHRASQLVEEVEIARVFDCAGVIADPARSSNPAIRSLLASGAARPDPLNIGLDVLSDGSLIGRDGVATDRLFAVGPLTRGAFLEIEAVPDIRVQCQRLAGALLDRLAYRSVATA